jgi:3-oxoacyl-[acyl-carrier protein] reductase
MGVFIMTDFKDKVALVTGASRGIGRAIAEALSLHGACVIANYNKSEKEISSLVDSLQSKNCAIEAMRADVTDGKAVEGMVDEIVKRYERIDILVNNAGLNKDSFLALMSDEDWKKVIDTNLNSVFYVTKWVSRVMMRQREGRIINISSLSAFKGLAGQTNYAASKGGVISFTRAAARELARFGIRVNAIAPGLIETDIIKDMDQGALEELTRGIPLGRIGTVNDIAKAVLFLASSEADYITGQALLIDGGLGI